MRERLGKLFGRLGSDSAGERANALEAIERALQGAGLTWGWVSDVVAQGGLPTDPDAAARDALFGDLVAERLSDAVAESWALSVAEAAVIGAIRKSLGAPGDLRGIATADLAEGLRIATKVRRRIGRR